MEKILHVAYILEQNERETEKEREGESVCVYVCMREREGGGEKECAYTYEWASEREKSEEENTIVSDSLAFFATFSRTNRIYNRGVTVVFVKRTHGWT